MRNKNKQKTYKDNTLAPKVDVNYNFVLYTYNGFNLNGKKSVLSGGGQTHELLVSSHRSFHLSYEC